MRLIVTRPEPDATRTAQALMQLGHAAILSPMLDIVTLPKAPISERTFQAVLVTSANAVRALAGRPVRPFASKTALFAVGDQTALEAIRAGFTGARSAGGTLDDLLRLAEAELEPSSGPILYAAGEDRAGDLAVQLEALGFDVETAILYRAAPRKTLAKVAEAALREGSADGALLYSRRSAEAFAGALQSAGLAPLPPNFSWFCLSDGCAEPLTACGGRILVAERPDQISLFQLIDRAAAMSAAPE